MSNDNPSNKHNSDEIDIIQFFSYLGRGFRNFLDSILNFFKWLFHVFISLLILIQKNLVYFIIAAAVGFIGGGVFDHTKPVTYEASMIVQPNYSSTEQLYNNINYYNELATSKDSVALGEVIGISSTEAGAIKSITIEPSINKAQKLRLYDEFIKELDTLTRQSFDYEDFEKNLTDYDAVYHKVTVVSKKSTVAKEIEEEIITSVSENNFFKLQNNVQEANIKFQDSIYKKQLVAIDSLQSVYKKALLATANKTNQGTNISLSEGQTQGGTQPQIQLLAQVDELRENLVSLNKEKVKLQNIVNVLAEFPERGTKVNAITKSWKLIFPVIFIGLLFVFLLLVELNKFLKKYTSN